MSLSTVSENTTMSFEDNVFEDNVSDIIGGANPVMVKADYLNIKSSKLINKAINDYVEHFLCSIVINPDTDNNSILSQWKNTDNQYQLNAYIHQNKIKMKKKVDTNEPKKPDTAFIYFSKEQRERIKKENPEADAEIIPMIASLWQEVKEDPEKIKKYVDLAKADKLRFDTETNRLKVEKKKEDMRLKLEKRMAKKKEINDRKIKKAMEKPKSAYFFFIQDEKPLIIQEFGDKEFTKKDVHNELQKRWKTLKTDNIERFEKYNKIAEEKAKELPTLPPQPIKKKEKKYTPPREQKINEAKKSKYDKNKERNKLRENPIRLTPECRHEYNPENSRCTKCNIILNIFRGSNIV